MEKELENRLNSVLWDAQRKTAMRPRGRLAPEVISKADVLIQRGAYSEARDLVQAEPSLDQDPTALQALALALIGLDRPEEARDVLQKAIERLREHLSAAFSNLSVAYFEAGDVDGALLTARSARGYKYDWCGPWGNELMCHCSRRDSDAVRTAVDSMDNEWPAWQHDDAMRERIQEDSTLRFLRESVALRRLFPGWLS